MNRQLKFRVWDKLEKRLIYPDKGYQGHFILDLNGRFHNLQNGSGGEEYVAQQFTGLQDKNGKDIYEGDILKWHQGDNNLSEVVYENGAFFVKGINWGAHWYLGDYNNVYEVNGNIFENSELLQKIT